MALSVEPAAGMVAVEFLDDKDAEEEESYSSASNATPSDPGDYNQAIFAMCLGAAKTYEGKPSPYKRGDTLIVRKSSRKNAIEIGGHGCLISTYDVLGRVKS